MTFPIAGHGACHIDQMFSVFKLLTGYKHVPAMPTMERILQDSNSSEINVHELTSMLDLHRLEAPEWPTGLQAFHAFHFFEAPQGVVLQAKQLLGSKLSNIAPEKLWVGNDKGSPQLILPHDCPLPLLHWLKPSLQTATKVATDVLRSPYLVPAASDRAWWTDVALRYALPPLFSWTLQTNAPFTEGDPITAESLASVAKLLDLTPMEAQNAVPLYNSNFYEGPRCAKEYGKLTAYELKRRGLCKSSSPATAVHESEASLREKQRARAKTRKTKKAAQVASEDAEGSGAGPLRMFSLCLYHA